MYIGFMVDCDEDDSEVCKMRNMKDEFQPGNQFPREVKSELALKSTLAER